VSAEGSWSVCGSEPGDGVGFGLALALAFGFGGGGARVDAVGTVSGMLAVLLAGAVVRAAVVRAEAPHPLAKPHASTAIASAGARGVMPPRRAPAGSR
jgi:hypothetical protein